MAGGCQCVAVGSTARCSELHCVMEYLLHVSTGNMYPIPRGYGLSAKTIEYFFFLSTLQTDYLLPEKRG